MVTKSFTASMDKWKQKGYRQGFSPYLFSPNPDKKCRFNPYSETFDPTFFAVMMGQTEQEYARRYPISYERWINA